MDSSKLYAQNISDEDPYKNTGGHPSGNSTSQKQKLAELENLGDRQQKKSTKLIREEDGNATPNR